METNKTTGEQIKELNRLVKFVLFNIATGADPDGESTTEQRIAIEIHAENLFRSVSWVGEIAGRFATLPPSALEALDAEFNEAYIGAKFIPNGLGVAGDGTPGRVSPYTFDEPEAPKTKPDPADPLAHYPNFVAQFLHLQRNKRDEGEGGDNENR